MHVEELHVSHIKISVKLSSTSSRYSKNTLHAVKNKAHLYYWNRRNKQFNFHYSSTESSSAKTQNWRKLNPHQILMEVSQPEVSQHTSLLDMPTRKWKRIWSIEKPRNKSDRKPCWKAPVCHPECNSSRKAKMSWRRFWNLQKIK